MKSNESPIFQKTVCFCVRAFLFVCLFERRVVSIPFFRRARKPRGSAPRLRAGLGGAASAGFDRERAKQRDVK